MTQDIVKTLHALKLPGMARNWEALSETHQLDRLSLRDGMALMVQAETDMRTDNRIARLIHNAHFRQHASIDMIDADATRGISAARLADFATGAYLDKGMTIIITGAAGTGKSFLASAFGDRACRQGRKVMYFTMNMLVENLRLVRLEGRQTNFFRKVASQDLLILDDFGMQSLDGEIQNDFEQIVDDRYAAKSLIICSQLPVEDWYGIFRSELIAEACLDRIVHRSERFTLKGESLRKKY